MDTNVKEREPQGPDWLLQLLKLVADSLEAHPEIAWSVWESPEGWEALMWPAEVEGSVDRAGALGIDVDAVLALLDGEPWRGSLGWQKPSAHATTHGVTFGGSFAGKPVVFTIVFVAPLVEENEDAEETAPQPGPS